LGWVQVTFEGPTDMILPPWPNIWQVMLGETVERERVRPGVFPLIQEAALQYAQETLKERIEKCESGGDYLLWAEERRETVHEPTCAFNGDGMCVREGGSKAFPITRTPGLL
jgi:hypothetical protein